MKMPSIANKLKEHFNFLKDTYGFRDVSHIIDKDYCSIKMQNNTTGIALNFERRESDVFVYLYRLVNGKMLEDRNPLSSDVPLNSIELRYIIQLREGGNYTRVFGKQSSKTYDELIMATAAALKKYADDVLKGNFEVFNEVDAIAKRRRLEWEKS